MVQGLIVGPTWNPLFREFNKTLLTKKLLPVLYFPTILITPIFLFSGIYLINCSAYGLRVKPCFSEYEMNGIANSDFVLLIAFILLTGIIQII